MNPKELVAQFIEEKLGGDISRLATFPELMRAVYCLVFGEVWEGLSMDNLGDGKLRGDTLNTYNTLFSQPWNEKFTAIWNPDDELKARLKEFQTTCYTIGNMAVLPDRRIGEWSINKHRGCHNEWHDYEDRFLEALYLVLTGDSKRDLDLEELVELNKEDFVDSDYVPAVRSKGYTYWRGGYTNRDRFLSECHRYIDNSTEIIHKRAKTMIAILKHKLG